MRCAFWVIKSRVLVRYPRCSLGRFGILVGCNKPHPTHFAALFRAMGSRKFLSRGRVQLWAGASAGVDAGCGQGRPWVNSRAGNVETVDEVGRGCGRPLVWAARGRCEGGPWTRPAAHKAGRGQRWAAGWGPGRWPSLFDESCQADHFVFLANEN